jgi:HEAT repeat protein
MFQNFDKVSFWLGFLAASLFWWIAVRLWRHFPQAKTLLKNRFTNLRAQQIAGIDGTLLREVLKRAQRNHLAGMLFSLEEILVVPQLQAPPPQVDPDNPDPFGSFRPPIIPNLPYVPQFSSQYGGESLSLVRTVRSGLDLAIIGHPGAGKTAALAYLASLFARKDISLGSMAQYFPIYLHVNDIEDLADTNQEPADILIKALSWNTPATSRPQLPGFIHKTIAGKKAILILDGLDEIPFDSYQQAVGFLSRLVKAQPKLRIVTTAALDRANGLFELGIEPMPLAGWTRGEITSFAKRWGSLWNTHIVPQKGTDNGSSIDDLLINTWQAADGDFYTPIELTCRLWGAYSGDLPGARGVDAVSAFFSRLESQGVSLQSLASLADQLITMKQGFTTYIDAEKEFTTSGSSYSNLIDERPRQTVTQNPVIQIPLENLRLDKKLRSATSEEKSVDKLIEMGVLREHPHERLSFSSPVLWGYVAALSNYTYDLSSKSPDDDPWSAESEFFHYLISSTPAEWLKAYLAEDTAPFYLRTTLVALWMRDLTPGSANRSFIMRHLLALTQLETLPYPTRLGLLGAAAMSNDPAQILLMKQLASSASVPLKQIAALCSGILRDPKSIAELTTAGTDEQELVRFAACFAIAALETPEAQATIESTINQGDEHMRLAVAEAAASRPPWGHKLLRDAASSADILTRRAAIFGLMQVKSPWVAELFEKIATEDGQFVVRNLAGSAMETLQRDRNNQRVVQGSPIDTPWLITYAAKSGRGIPRNESPVPLLLKVASSGNPDQQIAAVQLLARCQDESAVEGIRTALGAADLDLRVAAHYALWFANLTHTNSAS